MEFFKIDESVFTFVKHDVIREFGSFCLIDESVFADVIEAVKRENGDIICQGLEKRHSIDFFQIDESVFSDCIDSVMKEFKVQEEEEENFLNQSHESENLLEGILIGEQNSINNVIKDNEDNLEENQFSVPLNHSVQNDDNSLDESIIESSQIEVQETVKPYKKRQALGQAKDATNIEKVGNTPKTSSRVLTSSQKLFKPPKSPKKDKIPQSVFQLSFVEDDQNEKAATVSSDAIETHAKEIEDYSKANDLEFPLEPIAPMEMNDKKKKSKPRKKLKADIVSNDAIKSQSQSIEEHSVEDILDISFKPIELKENDEKKKNRPRKKLMALDFTEFMVKPTNCPPPIKVQKLTLKEKATVRGDSQDEPNEEKQIKEPLVIKTQDSQTQMIEDQTQQSTQSSTTNRKRRSRSPGYIVPHDVGTNYNSILYTRDILNIFSISDSLYRRTMGTMR